MHAITIIAVLQARGVATIEATEAAASPKKIFLSSVSCTSQLYNKSLLSIPIGLFKCPYYNLVNGLTYVCNLDFSSRSRIAR